MCFRIIICDGIEMESKLRSGLYREMSLWVTKLSFCLF